MPVGGQRPLGRAVRRERVRARPGPWVLRARGARPRPAVRGEAAAAPRPLLASRRPAANRRSPGLVRSRPACRRRSRLPRGRPRARGRCAPCPRTPRCRSEAGRPPRTSGRLRRPRGASADRGSRSPAASRTSSGTASGSKRSSWAPSSITYDETCCGHGFSGVQSGCGPASARVQPVARARRQVNARLPRFFALDASGGDNPVGAQQLGDTGCRFSRRALLDQSLECVSADPDTGALLRRRDCHRHQGRIHVPKARGHDRRHRPRRGSLLTEIAWVAFLAQDLAGPAECRIRRIRQVELQFEVVHLREARPGGLRSLSHGPRRRSATIARHPRRHARLAPPRAHRAPHCRRACTLLTRPAPRLGILSAQ
jgi:hypothetical protein